MIRTKIIPKKQLFVQVYLCHKCKPMLCTSTQDQVKRFWDGASNGHLTLDLMFRKLYKKNHNFVFLRYKKLVMRLAYSLSIKFNSYAALHMHQWGHKLPAFWFSNPWKRGVLDDFDECSHFFCKWTWMQHQGQSFTRFGWSSTSPKVLETWIFHS